MQNLNVAIIHNKISPNPLPDEEDVIFQVQSVKKAMEQLGFFANIIEFDINIMNFIEKIKKQDLIFNLVESYNNDPRLMVLPALIYERFKLPYTGSKSKAIALTTNKLITKKVLISNKILTSDWISSSSRYCSKKVPLWILKPLLEDASIGINESSIVSSKNMDVILKKIEKNDCFFAEEYVEGREFNVSVLETNEGPIVLPIAEMLFINFPNNKPKILGYEAKWDVDSFEYNNTQRTFDFSANDKNILDELAKISLECWKIFDLQGYVRVDFRVDKNNLPYVLEINTNPCISPDSGFIAAAKRANLSYKDVVEKIINSVF